MGYIRTFSGTNGELHLYDDKVVISRNSVLGKLAHGLTKGDKSIYFNQISGIQLSRANALSNGYIQFTIAGGMERTGGLTSAVNDENSVIFNRGKNDEASAIVDEIESLRQKGMTQTPSVTMQQASEADELFKFKQLLDSGVITQDEFNAKKKQLLGL